MCIGIPMVVESVSGHRAICRKGEERSTVDLALIGPQPAGTWVLVFLGSAREILTPERAQQIELAHAALTAAANGENTDFAFADFLAEGPTLPPHLEEARQAGRAKA
ncbi:MAG TPA: HypC/HybG/HupF family hydrogenase formation chaperone [Beijerinckia sp.]|nr:HypC/HybG/HupF family hydrogenase formation chaperone [Beijerinckia sp.]